MVATKPLLLFFGTLCFLSLIFLGQQGVNAQGGSGCGCANSCNCTDAICPGCPVVKVYVSIFINAISQVNGVDENFFADFYLQAWWIDPTYSGSWQSGVNLDPTIEFQNSAGGVTATTNPYLTGVTGPSGVAPYENVWSTTNQRYFGTFDSPLDLSNFPYDQQDLILGIESNLWDNNFIAFEPAPGFNDNLMAPGFLVTEWDAYPTPGNFTPFYSLNDHYYANFNQTYSRFEVHVPLQRQANYYIFKIFLGSILLVLMSIASSALDVEDPNRMMACLTNFLALISFLFVAGTSIPKVAYETRLDDFMNFSFLITFFMLLQHSISYLINEFLVAEEEEEEKKKRESINLGEVAADKVEKAHHEEADSKKHKKHTGPFGWFMNLRLPRRIDIVMAIIFSVIYTIGVPCILYV